MTNITQVRYAPIASNQPQTPVGRGSQPMYHPEPSGALINSYACLTLFNEKPNAQLRFSTINNAYLRNPASSSPITQYNETHACSLLRELRELRGKQSLQAHTRFKQAAASPRKVMQAVRKNASASLACKPSGSVIFEIYVIKSIPMPKKYPENPSSKTTQKKKYEVKTRNLRKYPDINPSTLPMKKYEEISRPPRSFPSLADNVRRQTFAMNRWPLDVPRVAAEVLRQTPITPSFSSLPSRPSVEKSGLRSEIAAQPLPICVHSRELAGNVSGLRRTLCDVLFRNPPSQSIPGYSLLRVGKGKRIQLTDAKEAGVGGTPLNNRSATPRGVCLPNFQPEPMVCQEEALYEWKTSFIGQQVTNSTREI